MTRQLLADIGTGVASPRFSIEADGTTFADTTGLFTDVTVERTIDGADHFSLTIASRFDLESGEFVEIGSDDMPIGAPIEIEVGYGGDLERVLIGEITEHTTEFPASGPPRIIISGYGRYHELTRDVHEEQWDPEMSDGEIVEELAAAYGLKPVVDDTPDGSAHPVENEYDSDAAFLEEKLAPRNENGTGPFDVYVRGDELVFRAPRDDADSQRTLTYGESLVSFSPRMTEAQTHERVEVRHWDQRRKREIVGVAERADGTGTRTIRAPVHSEAQAEAVARATLTEELHDRLTGSGTTIGMPGLQIGEPIRIHRIGARFSGRYYVTSVTHTIDGRGFTTDFDVRGIVEEEIA